MEKTIAGTMSTMQNKFFGDSYYKTQITKLLTSKVASLVIVDIKLVRR